MSKKRRPSPTEEDIRRVTEALRNTYQIKDYNSFDDAWKDYFEENPEMRFRDDLKLQSFGLYADLYADRLIDSTISKKELKGKERERVKKLARDYRFTGRIKEKGKTHPKVVYSYKDTITRYKKNINVFRDKKGRFTKVKE